MSYSTHDRHGGISTSYAHARGGVLSQGPGPTWWPDFGPGTRDFSAQPRSHPGDAIFEKIVQPGKWSMKERRAPSEDPVGSMFRNPQPAREAMLNQTASVESKAVARVVTERQAALRRMEMRQRRVDAWTLQAPVKMTAASLAEADRSRSESSLRDVSSSAASQASREVYRRHGYLVGRSKGSIADGVEGARPRRHNPLSYSAMMLSGDVVGSPGMRTRRAFRQRRPTQQWRVCPENRFVLDPKSCLPVPRGGQSALPPTSWPDAVPSGGREFAPGQESFGRASLSMPSLGGTAARDPVPTPS